MGNTFSSCICCNKCTKSSKEQVLPSDLHSGGGTVKIDGQNGNRPTNIKLQTTTRTTTTRGISNHDIDVHISQHISGDNSFSFPLHGIQKSSPVTPTTTTTGSCHGNNKFEHLMTNSIKREVNDESVRKFFNKYNDANNGGNDCDVILADGIQHLCEDLEISPTNFIILVFAWQLNAATQCQFTIDEFTRGCKKLNVDSISSLLMTFPYMEEVALEKENFKELYRYTFQFTLDNEQGQRTLPRDVAIAMWEIVFSKNTPQILQDWTDYLNNKNIRGISRDTWNMFLLLVDSLDCDYCNYDVTEAWPSLFDEFVEYKQKNRQENNKNNHQEVEDTSQQQSSSDMTSSQTNNEKTVTSPLLPSIINNHDDVTDDDEDSMTSSNVSSTKDDVIKC